jgi:prepilin-type N-terminal cleavage/methylation domain-containing protein
MSTDESTQPGMTILEVLIATMVLAVVAVIVFAAFGIGLRAAMLAGGLNTATSVAEETLATVTAAPCGSSFRQPIPPEAGEGPLAKYHREVTVEQRPGTNLYEIRATVTWTQERMVRSVTLTTLRYVSAACEFVGQ